MARKARHRMVLIGDVTYTVCCVCSAMSLGRDGYVGMAASELGSGQGYSMALSNQANSSRG